MCECVGFDEYFHIHIHHGMASHRIASQHQKINQNMKIRMCFSFSISIIKPTMTNQIKLMYSTTTTTYRHNYTKCIYAENET